MINFNSNSSSTTSLLQQVQEKQTSLMEKLASGKRINSAADGAAAQQIIDRLTSQVEGNRQAINNAYDGISLAQVAESGLSGISDDVNRIRELTLQAGSGVLNDADRQAIQSEITQLQDNISQTIDQTTFGGRPLLSAEGEINFQVGANPDQSVGVRTSDVAGNLSGILNIDITSGDLDAALQAADEAVESVGGFRADLGATHNALASTARNLSEADVNVSAARSRIQDLDYAQAVSENISNSVLGQAATSVQAQANQQQGQVLALLN